MSQVEDRKADWHCGGWEGAQRETDRIMQEMSFVQKIAWLQEAQQLIADIHGPEAALLPSGSTVMPKWYQR